MIFEGLQFFQENSLGSGCQQDENNDKIEQKLHQIATFYRQHPQKTLPKAIVEAIARYDEDLIHDQRSVSYAMHNAGDEIESWFEELADEKHRATVAGCPCVKKFTDIV